jgi:prepilin-type N-terminal cleavage/methylation domain-containing protein
MKHRAAGFTLLELLIGMAIGSFVLTAAVTFFILSFRQFKVQTKIVETNVEGVLGLEMFRQDLESMGFGLPWNTLVAYTERPGAAAAIAALDDTPNAPRAVVSIDCAAFTVNNSDYLVIKSARVGMDDAAGKWTTLTQDTVKRIWTPPEENIRNGDYVIVLRVGSTDANRRSLVTNSGTGSAYTTYNDTDNFIPVEPYSANIVYGIRDAATPVRPFNRAEYYIANAASNPPMAVPQHCAPNTGVLVKAPVAHDGSGSIGTPSNPLLPLLDCVADLQVVYVLDTNADGERDAWVNDIRTLLPTAADVRAQVVEVRAHLLVQEGQRDDTYQSPVTSFNVGSDGRGRPSFDVSGFRNYRWKVYTISVKPKNLEQ